MCIWNIMFSEHISPEYSALITKYYDVEGWLGQESGARRRHVLEYWHGGLEGQVRQRVVMAIVNASDQECLSIVISIFVQYCALLINYAGVNINDSSMILPSPLFPSIYFLIACH